MLKQKFTLSMVAVVVSSVLIPQVHAHVYPQSGHGSKFTNEGVICGSMAFIYSDEMINNGFINCSMDTTTSSNKYINYGTNTDQANNTRIFFVNGKNSNMNVVNYGLFKAFTIFNGHQSDPGMVGSYNNYGKNSIGSDLGSNFVKTPENYGLMVNKGTFQPNVYDNVTYSIKNYGVISAQQKDQLDLTSAQNNLGVIFYGDNANYIGMGGTVNINGTQMEIVNGTKDNGVSLNGQVVAGGVFVYTKHVGNVLTNKILNGNKLSLDGNATKVEISNSIINGGMEFSPDKANQELVIRDSIYNVFSEAENNSAYYTQYIRGYTKGNITTSFQGKTIINGDLLYENFQNNTARTNTINFDSSVRLNGNIDGNFNNHKLTTTINILNSGNNDNLKLFHEVKNVENFNVAGNATIFESAKFENVKNINIQNGGNLIVRAEMDKTKGPNGTVTGLALNNGTISSSGGNLVIDAFPVDPVNGSIISFGTTTLDNSLWGTTTAGQPVGPDSHVQAYHPLVDLYFKPQSPNEVILAAKDNLPTIPPTPQPNPQPPVDPNPQPNPQPPVDPNPQPPVDPNPQPNPQPPVDPNPQPTPPVDPNPQPTPPVDPNPPVNPQPNPQPQPTPPGGGNGGNNNGGNNNGTGNNNGAGNNGVVNKDQNAYEEIYDAIKDAGKFEDLKNTTDLEQIYWTLEQIYSVNPYGYTMKSNLDSLRLFNDVNYKTVMPRQGQNILTARAIYTGNRTDHYASGEGHFNERNFKTKSNTVGALITNEYGLDNKSIGLGLGYNKQNISFKELSRIKNDNFYVGLFLRNRIGNWSTKIGADYQFTRANVDHNIVSTQDSFHNKAKFNNHTASAYVEGAYSFDITDQFSISPVGRVAYYYIHQGAVDEGQGRLATRVDATHLNLVDLEAGLDLTFRAQMFGGSIKQILHMGAVGTFGDNDSTLYGSFTPSATGNPNNGYRFQGVTIPKVMGKVGYRVEYESLSNFIYSLGGNYEIGKRNQDFNANVGLGYKF